MDNVVEKIIEVNQINCIFREVVLYCKTSVLFVSVHCVVNTNNW